LTATQVWPVYAGRVAKGKGAPSDRKQAAELVNVVVDGSLAPRAATEDRDGQDRHPGAAIIDVASEDGTAALSVRASGASPMT